MLLTSIGALDELLNARLADLGNDFVGYRNHCYRVVNFCNAFVPAEGDQLERLAIAAAFHDLGIWTDRTFDYLKPSIRLACAHLAQVDKTDWSSEVSVMIREHHKISRCRQNTEWLTEPFRRADWIDVSRGLFSFGLRRRQLREIFSIWPDAGFHQRLVQLSIKRLCTHPWNPLPMLRL
jgi:hypothetical protein